MNRTIPSCVLFMAAAGILSAQSIAFDSAPAYLAPSSAFAVGDFNKDAKPDIASGVYTIVLLSGRETELLGHRARFRRSMETPPSFRWSSVTSTAIRIPISPRFIFPHPVLWRF